MPSAVVRLSAERGRLIRHHASLVTHTRGSARHDAWGVCNCNTAKRLREIAVALADTYRRPPGRDSGTRRCEGCNAPAVTADADDVPLCRPCAVACCESAAKDRPATHKDHPSNASGGHEPRQGREEPTDDAR